jgi:hypothetical protein
MDIKEAFNSLINNTAPESQVPIRDIYICWIDRNIQNVMKKEVYFLNPRSYISTKSIKHAYDRRPSFTRDNVGEIDGIIRYPDFVLKDNDKKGDFIFVKRSDLSKKKFICCPAEICMRESGHLSVKCVTFFPTKSRSYLRKFPTVWDREGGLLLHRDISLARDTQQ